MFFVLNKLNGSTQYSRSVSLFSFSTIHSLFAHNLCTVYKFVATTVITISVHKSRFTNTYHTPAIKPLQYEIA